MLALSEDTVVAACLFTVKLSMIQHIVLLHLTACIKWTWPGLVKSDTVKKLMTLLLKLSLNVQHTATVGPVSESEGLWALVELRGERSCPHLPKKCGGLCKTSGLRGYKGAWLQHIILITGDDAICSPKCDFCGPRMGLRKNSRLTIAHHILGPLVNYAIIRWLLVSWFSYLWLASLSAVVTCLRLD